MPGPEFYNLSFNVLFFITRTRFTKQRFKNMTELLQICPPLWVLSFQKLEMAQIIQSLPPSKIRCLWISEFRSVYHKLTPSTTNILIKKLPRWSSNDFIAQLIQNQINLQNEIFFFFQSTKTAHENMPASTNVFSRSTPQVHSVTSTRNKRQKSERKGRNTHFCPGIVQIHPSPEDYPNHKLEK